MMGRSCRKICLFDMDGTITHTRKPQPKKIFHETRVQDVSGRSPLFAGSKSSPHMSTAKACTTPKGKGPVKARTSLVFEELAELQDKQSEREITIRCEGTLEERSIPPEWRPVVKAVCNGDSSSAIDHVLHLDNAEEKLKDIILTRIKKETDDICRASENSSFRLTSCAALQEFSFTKQKEELEEKAPLFLSMMEAASISERMDKNTTKTKESIVPRLLMATSIMLNCKNQRMNAHQCINGLMLKSAGVKKRGIARLNAKGVSVSYSTTLEKQIEFSTDFDKSVKDWAEEVHRGNEKERQLLEQGDSEGLTEHNKTRQDHGYQLVMDNVDLMVHARHPTKTNYGKDYHMAHMIAVRNRLSAYHKSSEHVIPDLKSIHPELFLPDAMDNKLLKHEWAVLCARVITDHVPALKADLEGLPRQLPHDNMSEAKKKSDVINLGVIMENENTSEGIYRIMHHMHQYVPGHNTDKPTTIISAGDLLTCERESNCIEEQRNSSTPSKRLEGLMPVIGDFHALANYYQVVWKQLYDQTSGADKGTLYAARNYLQARNVTVDPMKNVNAAEHLLTQYTIALILAAAFLFFGLDNCESEPTKNKFQLDVHGDTETYAATIMHKFVEEFALPSNDEVRLEATDFLCNICQKQYASRKNLTKHQKDKHPGANDQALPNSSSSDAIQNYSRVALGMGLVAMDFTNARQHGDGDRLIRLYKFLLLHCKAARKPKYSFHILRFLAQVKVFLSPRLSYELVWNRFINTTGKPDGNVEMDRVMEHHNRIFKDNCRSLRGRITQKNVDRISRSAQQINSLMHHIDEEIAVKPPAARKHKVARHDAVTLAVELHKSDIFGFHPGRSHHRFPHFPVSVLGTLNAADVHEWIRSSVKKWYRQHQFQKR